MSEEPDHPAVPDPEAADAKPTDVPQPPLGAWRAPVFWMACGALLAMLAGSAFVVAQRVGLERDIAALAGHLPPVASVAPAAPIAPVAPVAQVSSPEAPVIAAQPVAPAPEQDAAPPPTTGAERRDSAERPPARPNRVAGAALRDKKQSYGSARARAPARAKASRQLAKSEAKPARQRARRAKAVVEHDLYWEVFKRCPLPGEPGAVECRRHVCNGAEREGPACKSYRGKWR